jgi:hypothetical protein
MPAAHADAEESPEREQHHVARREAAQEREARVPGDREEDRPLAAVSIGQRARADAADHSKEQRDGGQRARQREVDLEAAANVGEDEGDDREIERVEGPRGKGGQERLPFLAGHLFVPRHCEDSSREPSLDDARATPPRHRDQVQREPRLCLYASAQKPSSLQMTGERHLIDRS